LSGNINLSPSAPLVNVQRNPKSWTNALLERLGIVTTVDLTVVLTLIILVVLGFGLRITQLGAIGFAEDEMNKLDAIHSYERGDFSANAEHPMLMKMLNADLSSRCSKCQQRSCIAFSECVDRCIDGRSIVFVSRGIL
jgi:hypothetical protein